MQNTLKLYWSPISDAVQYISVYTVMIETINKYQGFPY